MPGIESQPPTATSPAVEAAHSETAPASPGDQNTGRNFQVRSFVESLLCLVLAVIVFRTFEVEGYMISTGSMAPSLLGFHKQVVCPTCQFPFAFGVAYQSEASHTISGEREEEGSASQERSEHRQLCTCPNCGQQAIDISQVPRNQGDQLLVFREAYWWRLPRRWEVIVFRNPYETTQAYVKRLAGLPGETIAIRHGDIYADGVLCRKDYATQKAVRIPVYDHDYAPPEDAEWESHWQPDDDWLGEGQGFITHGQSVPEQSAVDNENPVHGLEIPEPEPAWSWVTYGHYFRAGGRHVTKVELPIIQGGLDWPVDILPAQFDVKTRELSVTGVMSKELRERLLSVSDDPEYREAVKQLDEFSHYAPVLDDYGYNRASHLSGTNAVRDVMVSLNLDLLPEQPSDDAKRQFAVDMTDGESTFRLRLDFQKREVQLFDDPERLPGDPPLQTAPLRSEWETEACQVEMSLIDRQVTVAINGDEVFPAWPISRPFPERQPPRFPVRFGARNLAARVDSLELFRDVYYTNEDHEKPCRLNEDELFVLGDNSPVSLDSRRWKNGAVPLKLLLGKPFVVHLPSRQLKLRLGESSRHIRIPDFSRIRYIR